MLLFHRAKIAFCLTAEIEKDTNTASGFRCADRQFTTGRALYGELRFKGITAMTRLGFAERTVILGGRENRYPGENIGRAQAFKAILEKDFGAVGTIDIGGPNATGTTRHLLEVIRDMMSADPAAAYAVVSSFYHIPRICAQLATASMTVAVFPAEAFLLIENQNCRDSIVSEFGGGEFALRAVDELRGIADLLCGTYQARPTPEA